MKNIKITLETHLSEKEINKVMEEMLWDSEFSYQFENADWKIIK
jgi:hypothetical protein|tara:strand:+ start:1027 stop:1158 length:132 start_codon:yes stop_codon:yes gene_type:complete